jgi:hypothetical protein
MGWEREWFGLGMGGIDWWWAADIFGFLVQLLVFLYGSPIITYGGVVWHFSPSVTWDRWEFGCKIERE